MLLSYGLERSEHIPSILIIKQYIQGKMRYSQQIFFPGRYLNITPYSSISQSQHKTLPWELLVTTISAVESIPSTFHKLIR